MKIFKNIIRIALVVGTTTVMAQNRPPKPPTPPSTTTSSTTSSTTSRTTSVSDSGNVSVITQSGDYGKGGNTSFSVSSSNDEYRLKSRYPKNRYPAVKDFLIEELGTKRMQSSGKDMTWSLQADKGTVYEVELSETKLKIELDKTLASPDLSGKFDDMGAILRTLISGGNQRQELERLERDAERARRDAQRMQREAERLRALSQRDASRIEREAERLERESDRLYATSKRNGGIDGYVREVLKQPSTVYDFNSVSTDQWKWPALQRALIVALERDELISPDEEIVFVKEDSGMYVNGIQVKTSLWSSYNSLFRKYGYGDIEDISFYKQDDHIAVLSGPDDFEDLLDELEDEKLIRISKMPTVIEINGASVVVDGKKLSQSETDRWNTLLHAEHVIPAPGKTIKIDATSASLGYSFGKNTLGMWMSRD